MKKIVLLLILLYYIHPAICQEKEKTEAFYMLDANYKATTQRSAKFFIHLQKIADSCWQFDTYKVLGPLISSEQYKDEKGKGPNGTFSYYYANGFIDSTGDFKNGFQNGTWNYYDDAGKFITKKDFVMGHIITQPDESNSSNKKYPDNSFTHIESEAYFGKSPQSWSKYIYKNLSYPDGAAKNKIQGSVTVMFMIEENGSLSHVTVFKSIEYSLDAETMELVTKSKDWHPATRDGVKIKSIKKQGIDFKLSSGF